MRSSTKSRRLKFLVILAFIMAVCAIAVAEINNKDLAKAEVLTTFEQRVTDLQDILIAIDERLKRQQARRG